MCEWLQNVWKYEKYIKDHEAVIALPVSHPENHACEERENHWKSIICDEDKSERSHYVEDEDYFKYVDKVFAFLGWRCHWWALWKTHFVLKMWEVFYIYLIFNWFNEFEFNFILQFVNHIHLIKDYAWHHQQISAQHKRFTFPVLLCLTTLKLYFPLSPFWLLIVLSLQLFFFLSFKGW